MGEAMFWFGCAIALDIIEKILFLYNKKAGDTYSLAFLLFTLLYLFLLAFLF